MVFPFYQFHLPLEVNPLVPQTVGIGHHHITSAMNHEGGTLILCCRLVDGQSSGSLYITDPQLQSFEDINGSRRIEGIIVLIKLSKLAHIASSLLLPTELTLMIYPAPPYFNCLHTYLKTPDS